MPSPQRLNANRCKAKIWLPHVTSDIDGTVDYAAVQLFRVIPSAADRANALKLMQEEHARLLRREAEANQTA